MSSNRIFSHCKDIDLYILKKLDGRDLMNFLETCKYFYNLPNEYFWKEKTKFKFEKFLEIFSKITWKECYILENCLNPYWLSARYFEKDRKEMMLLMELVRNITNVIPISERDENGNLIYRYYTRDGTKNGIKEGKLIRWDHCGRKLYVANFRSGKRNGKTKE